MFDAARDRFRKFRQHTRSLKFFARHKKILCEIFAVRFERHHAASIRGKFAFQKFQCAIATQRDIRPRIFAHRLRFAAQKYHVGTDRRGPKMSCVHTIKVHAFRRSAPELREKRKRAQLKFNIRIGGGNALPAAHPAMLKVQSLAPQC
jgi:hypothetical protein